MRAQPGLGNALRITVGSADENRRLLAALDEVLDSINTADVATKTTGLPDQLIAERLLLEIAGRARRLGL